MQRISFTRKEELASFLKINQRAVTSQLRHGDIKKQSTRNIFFLLFLFSIMNLMTVEGFILKPSRHFERRSSTNPFNFLTRPNCVECYKTKPESLTTSQNRLSRLNSPYSCFFIAKVLRHFCGKMTVSKCITFYNQRYVKQKLKQIIFLYNQRRCNLLDSVKSSNDDMITSDQKINFYQAISPKYSAKKLSRQKRLAMSDRRLVHLYCRTNFILRITKNGTVIGSPEKLSEGK